MVTRKAASNKLPKLEFRYSWVYDHENRLRFTDPLYPSGDDIREYVAKVREAWRPRKRTILSAIARLSGLDWQEESMVCYVVGRGVPMSDPLTLPVYEKRPGLFVEKLAYQLVERMLMNERNLRSRGEFWEGMFRSLAGDGVKVSYMVPVNAIYQEIWSRYFKEPGSDPDSSLLTTNLDYRRAWEIVREQGHSGIMERFRRGKWD